MVFFSIKRGLTYNFLPFISTLIQELEIPYCQIILSRGNLLKSTKVLKDLSKVGKSCSLTFSIKLKSFEFVVGDHLGGKSLKKTLYVSSEYPKFEDISIDQEVLFLNALSGEWYEYYTIEGVATKNSLGAIIIKDNEIKVNDHFFRGTIHLVMYRIFHRLFINQILWHDF